MTLPRLVHRSPARRLAAAALLGALAVTSFMGCTGGEDPVTENQELDDDGDGEVTPEEVLAAAKERLDETSGVEIRLSTGDEPRQGDFLASADGTLTAAPRAFEGTVAGRVMGTQASDINVVALGGDVWVEVPILGWQTYDPSEFCAPDPAALLDPETGVSPILTAASELEAGEAALEGEDNEHTVQDFTGTVPGEEIRNILPCAAGDSFDATFSIDNDGYLRQAELTGEFFSGGESMTYAIEVLEYDVAKEITAPK